MIYEAYARTLLKWKQSTERLRNLEELVSFLDVLNDTSDDGESYMVMGNVDTALLKRLGMK